MYDGCLFRKRHTPRPELPRRRKTHHLPSGVLPMQSNGPRRSYYSQACTMWSTGLRNVAGRFSSSRTSRPSLASATPGTCADVSGRWCLHPVTHRCQISRKPWRRRRCSSRCICDRGSWTRALRRQRCRSSRIWMWCHKYLTLGQPESMQVEEMGVVSTFMIRRLL